MGITLLSILLNLLFMFAFVFIIALGIMWMLNPTASLDDIFTHWEKTWKGEYDTQRKVNKP